MQTRPPPSPRAVVAVAGPGVGRSAEAPHAASTARSVLGPRRPWAARRPNPHGFLRLERGGAAVMINPPALIVPAGSLFPLGFQLWKMLLFRRPPTRVAPQRERGTAQGKPCGGGAGLAPGSAPVGPLGPGSGGALPADGGGAVGSLSPKIRAQERAPAGSEEGGCCSQHDTACHAAPGPAAPQRRAGHAANLGPGRLVSWGN